MATNPNKVWDAYYKNKHEKMASHPVTNAIPALARAVGENMRQLPLQFSLGANYLNNKLGRISDEQAQRYADYLKNTVGKLGDSPEWQRQLANDRKVSPIIAEYGDLLSPNKTKVVTSALEKFIIEPELNEDIVQR